MISRTARGETKALKRSGIAPCSTARPSTSEKKRGPTEATLTISGVCDSGVLGEIFSFFQRSKSSNNLFQIAAFFYSYCALGALCALCASIVTKFVFSGSSHHPCRLCWFLSCIYIPQTVSEKVRASWHSCPVNAWV